DIGYGNRLGWFHGLGLLLAVHPEGIVTGWGFGPASAKDQTLAETFFAARQAVGQGQAPCARSADRPGEPRVCLGSVGSPAERVYLADKGFGGIHTQRRWRQRYAAQVIAPPQDERVRHPW